MRTFAAVFRQFDAETAAKAPKNERGARNCETLKTRANTRVAKWGRL